MGVKVFWAGKRVLRKIRRELRKSKPGNVGNTRKGHEGGGRGEKCGINQKRTTKARNDNISGGHRE